MRGVSIRVVTIFVIASLLSLGSYAQSVKDVRINEVMVKNVDSYVDDYGHHSSWIELQNSGHSKVNIAGAVLKLTHSNGEEINYRIPKNDARTNINPQSYVIFFADGQATKGTFYTNFTLNGKGKLELFDASGRGDVISSFEFDFDTAAENKSAGYYTSSRGEEEIWCAELPQITPGSTNNTTEFIAKSEEFRQLDPTGVVMALTAMFVVFTALLLLYQIFKLVGKSMIRRAARKENRLLQSEGSEKVVTVSDEQIQEEVIAAIGVALKRYEDEILAMESTVLTINRVARTYSPWSSKIYGITNQITKK